MHNPTSYPLFILFVHWTVETRAMRMIRKENINRSLKERTQFILTSISTKYSKKRQCLQEVIIGKGEDIAF